MIIPQRAEICNGYFSLRDLSAATRGPFTARLGNIIAGSRRHSRFQTIFADSSGLFPRPVMRRIASDAGSGIEKR